MTDLDREAWALYDAVKADLQNLDLRDILADWLSEHGGYYCFARPGEPAYYCYADSQRDHAKRLRVERGELMCNHLDRHGRFADAQGMFISQCRYCGFSDDSMG